MSTDVCVVIASRDLPRLSGLYDRLMQLPENGKLFFMGDADVGRMVSEYETTKDAGFINENDIIPFDSVHALMKERLSPYLKGAELPRGVTGWYYQQFLKMEYARHCVNDWYLVWDGDTLPCRKISMFSENGVPYFDLKHEYKPEYFETMERLLPGVGKVIGRSFISEHMLIKKEYMLELIEEIEQNESIPGNAFWEKILNSIPAEKIQEAVFSEFEIYGSFVAIRHQSAYRLRSWHSFRLGGEFFDPATICDRDFEWLGRDFDAISFEKGHFVREDHKNLFDNPRYQEKLSPRKMLETVQEVFQDGYIEVWD